MGVVARRANTIAGPCQAGRLQPFLPRRPEVGIALQTAFLSEGPGQFGAEVDDHVVASERRPEGGKILAALLDGRPVALPLRLYAALLRALRRPTDRQPGGSAGKTDLFLAHQIVEVTGEEVIDGTALRPRREAAFG